jgi:hypothetical protein
MAFFVFVLFCITARRSAVRRVVRGAARRPLISSPTMEDHIYIPADAERRHIKQRRGREIRL